MTTSLVRTLAALVVGWVLSLPLAGPVMDALGVSRDQVTTGVVAVVTALAGVLALAYHTVVRWAEQRWPWVSVFLASIRQPVYVPTAEAARKARKR